MEYALDLNPNIPDSAGLPKVEKIVYTEDHYPFTAGTYLQISFFRARNDIGYNIRYSTDLQAWNTVYYNPGTVGQTVTYQHYNGSNPNQFISLLVSYPY